MAKFRPDLEKLVNWLRNQPGDYCVEEADFFEGWDITGKIHDNLDEWIEEARSALRKEGWRIGRLPDCDISLFGRDKVEHKPPTGELQAEKR